MNGTALRTAPLAELCEMDRRSVRPGDPPAADPVRILTEPENSPIRQYTAPMATEEVTVEFTADAIDAIASLAAEVNAGVENIGARRLHTMMERLLEDVSFSAADRAGATAVFDAAAVEKTLGDLARGADLGKFIL